MAARQFGRIAWVQLKGCGIDGRTIQRWTTAGYLFHILPRVYAVGHRAATTETRLMEAVLYAGPGAMLSHATAAWWLGLVNTKPYMIDVSTPRRCKSTARDQGPSAPDAPTPGPQGPPGHVPSSDNP